MDKAPWRRTLGTDMAATNTLSGAFARMNGWRPMPPAIPYDDGTQETTTPNIALIQEMKKRKRAGRPGQPRIELSDQLMEQEALGQDLRPSNIEALMRAIEQAPTGSPQQKALIEEFQRLQQAYRGQVGPIVPPAVPQSIPGGDIQQGPYNPADPTQQPHVMRAPVNPQDPFGGASHPFVPGRMGRISM